MSVSIGIHHHFNICITSHYACHAHSLINQSLIGCFQFFAIMEEHCDKYPCIFSHLYYYYLRVDSLETYTFFIASIIIKNNNDNIKDMIM